jgi:hypothetical protein
MAVNNFQHPFYDLGPVPCQARYGAPCAHKVARSLHSPAKQPVRFNGQERGFVTPIFEKFSTLPGIARVVQQQGSVRSQTGEERKIVGPNKNVHGIDLEHAESICNSRDMPACDAGRSPKVKSLRAQDNAARLTQRQRV